MEHSLIWRSAAFAAALLLVPLTVPAIAGPFTAMSGSWSGGGTLTMSNGSQDRLSCRANYMVGVGGDSLKLNIRCASDNYKFDLASNVVEKDGTISGEWSEASRNARGTLTGRAQGGRIDIVARSDLFTASLSLTTGRNQQSVTIVPQGSEVTRVSLTLSKR